MVTYGFIAGSAVLDGATLGASGRTTRRSQTEPVSLTMPRPIPLRRSRTTSARLDALQRAYAAVAEDSSQIHVEDLVQATRLVHQIGTVLNEQMGRRLADPG